MACTKSFDYTKGRLAIHVSVVPIGSDFCIIISGGDTPHIGSISFANEKNDIDSFSFPNHKDSIVSEKILSQLSERINTNVVILCGIHLDQITKAEIDDVYHIADLIATELLSVLR